jgi:hypothetical protein
VSHASRLRAQIIEDVEKHLRRLRHIRWRETRPTLRDPQIARGKARAKIQGWRRGDSRSRTWGDKS